MEGKEIICIVCPLGCQMEVCGDAAAGYSVKGNACSRGEKYGIKELSDPTRVLTTTVRLRSRLNSRLPVRSDGPIPKGMIFPCMKLLNLIVTEAPVEIGSVIVENILGTGANIVAARSIR